MKKNNFHLFSSCILVKGQSRSVIQDVQMNRYKFIPNLLLEVLKLTADNSVSEIKKHFNSELDEGIEKYLAILEGEGYGGFFDSKEEKSSFPNLKLKYYSPSIIENAHVDVDLSKQNEIKELNELSSELSSLKCGKIALFFQIEPEKQELETVLKIFSAGRVEYIELYMPFSTWMNEDSFISIIRDNPAVIHVFVHSSPFDEKNKKALKMVTNLEFCQEKLTYGVSKGVFYPVFRNNLKLAAESSNYNAYFNQKIYRGIDGGIGNSYGTKLHFLNSEEKMNLKGLVASTSFQELWHAKKDKTDICKVCEFRYMCVDDRVPVKRKDGWYHETECAYNPFISKFYGDEGFLNLAETGVYSNATGFEKVKD